MESVILNSTNTVGALPDSDGFFISTDLSKISTIFNNKSNLMYNEDKSANVAFDELVITMDTSDGEPTLHINGTTTWDKLEKTYLGPGCDQGYLYLVLGISNDKLGKEEGKIDYISSSVSNQGYDDIIDLNYRTEETEKYVVDGNITWIGIIGISIIKKYNNCYRRFYLNCNKYNDIGNHNSIKKYIKAYPNISINGNHNTISCQIESSNNIFNPSVDMSMERVTSYTDPTKYKLCIKPSMGNQKYLFSKDITEPSDVTLIITLPQGLNISSTTNSIYSIDPNIVSNDDGTTSVTIIYHLIRKSKNRDVYIADTSLSSSNSKPTAIIYLYSDYLNSINERTDIFYISVYGEFSCYIDEHEQIVNNRPYYVSTQLTYTGWNSIFGTSYTSNDDIVDKLYITSFQDATDITVTKMDLSDNILPIVLNKVPSIKALEKAWLGEGCGIGVVNLTISTLSNNTFYLFDELKSFSIPIPGSEEASSGSGIIIPVKIWDRENGLQHQVDVTVKSKYDKDIIIRVIIPEDIAPINDSNEITINLETPIESITESLTTGVVKEQLNTRYAWIQYVFLNLSGSINPNNITGLTDDGGINVSITVPDGYTLASASQISGSTTGTMNSIATQNGNVINLSLPFFISLSSVGKVVNQSLISLPLYLTNTYISTNPSKYNTIEYHFFINSKDLLFERETPTNSGLTLFSTIFPSYIWDGITKENHTLIDEDITYLQAFTTFPDIRNIVCLESAEDSNTEAITIYGTTDRDKLEKTYFGYESGAGYLYIGFFLTTGSTGLGQSTKIKVNDKIHDLYYNTPTEKIANCIPDNIRFTIIPIEIWRATDNNFGSSNITLNIDYLNDDNTNLGSKTLNISFPDVTWPTLSDSTLMRVQLNLDTITNFDPSVSTLMPFNIQKEFKFIDRIEYARSNSKVAIKYMIKISGSIYRSGIIGFFNIPTVNADESKEIFKALYAIDNDQKTIGISGFFNDIPDVRRQYINGVETSANYIISNILFNGMFIEPFIVVNKVDDENVYSITEDSLIVNNYFTTETILNNKSLDYKYPVFEISVDHNDLSVINDSEPIYINANVMAIAQIAIPVYNITYGTNLPYDETDMTSTSIPGMVYKQFPGVFSNFNTDSLSLGIMEPAISATWILSGTTRRALLEMTHYGPGSGLGYFYFTIGLVTIDESKPILVSKYSINDGDIADLIPGDTIGEAPQILFGMGKVLIWSEENGFIQNPAINIHLYNTDGVKIITKIINVQFDDNALTLTDDQKYNYSLSIPHTGSNITYTSEMIHRDTMVEGKTLSLPVLKISLLGDITTAKVTAPNAILNFATPVEKDIGFTMIIKDLSVWPPSADAPDPTPYVLNINPDAFTDPPTSDITTKPVDISIPLFRKTEHEGEFLPIYKPSLTLYMANYVTMGLRLEESDPTYFPFIIEFDTSDLFKNFDNTGHIEGGVNIPYNVWNLIENTNFTEGNLFGNKSYESMFDNTNINDTIEFCSHNTEDENIIELNGTTTPSKLENANLGPGTGIGKIYIGLYIDDDNPDDLKITHWSIDDGVTFGNFIPDVGISSIPDTTIGADTHHISLSIIPIKIFDVVNGFIKNQTITIKFYKENTEGEKELVGSRSITLKFTNENVIDTTDYTYPTCEYTNFISDQINTSLTKSVESIPIYNGNNRESQIFTINLEGNISKNDITGDTVSVNINLPENVKLAPNKNGEDVSIENQVVSFSLTPLSESVSRSMDNPNKTKDIYLTNTLIENNTTGDTFFAYRVNVNTDNLTIIDNTEPDPPVPTEPVLGEVTTNTDITIDDWNKAWGSTVDSKDSYQHKLISGIFGEEPTVTTTDDTTTITITGTTTVSKLESTYLGDGSGFGYVSITAGVPKDSSANYFSLDGGVTKHPLIVGDNSKFDVINVKIWDVVNGMHQPVDLNITFYEGNTEDEESIGSKNISIVIENPDTIVSSNSNDKVEFTHTKNIPEDINISMEKKVYGNNIALDVIITGNTDSDTIKNDPDDPKDYIVVDFTLPDNVTLADGNDENITIVDNVVSIPLYLFIDDGTGKYSPTNEFTTDVILKNNTGNTFTYKVNVKPGTINIAPPVDINDPNWGKTPPRKLGNYTQTNTYNMDGNLVNFITPVSMIRSTARYTYNNDGIIDKDSGRVNGGSYNINIESVPLVRASTMKDPKFANEFINFLTRQYNHMNNVLNLVTNNYSIDMKFYNTYGKSKNFFIGDAGEENLDKVNISIHFHVKPVFGTSEEILIRDLKIYIKKYIETINDAGSNSFYVSNLIQAIENDFSEVKYLKFVGINDYDSDIQVIENKTEDLTQLTKDQRKVYVPEYLTISPDDIIIDIIS